MPCQTMPTSMINGWRIGYLDVKRRETPGETSVANHVRIGSGKAVA